MRASDRMRDGDELLQRSGRGKPRRECSAIVIRIDRAQPDETLPLRGIEQREGGAHVQELRVASRTRWQLPRVQHSRGRGSLGVRVVGVEGLEQTRSASIEAAE